MDPRATLKRIEECATDGDGTGAREACADLLAWFSAGGFPVGKRTQRNAIRDYFHEATADHLKALVASFDNHKKGL